MYETSKTVFDHNNLYSKDLDVHPKYSTVHHIFNSLLGVWKCGQMQVFVFDVILQIVF